MDLAGRLAKSVDDWHLPRAVRIRRGDESPEGCYHDSFDVEALVRDLLQPFAAGAPRVRTACFDHRADSPVDVRTDAGPQAVLVVEGVFLLRPELRPHWDLAVHLHVSDDVVLRRAVARDCDLLGGEDAVVRRYERRYLPAQALYRQEADPLATADVVVDTTDPARPVLRGASAAP